MAYAQTTPNIEIVPTPHGRIYLISFVETEVGSGSPEWTLDAAAVPRIGTITSYVATVYPGSGDKITPVIGRRAGFAAGTNDFIAAVVGTAIAHVDVRTNIRYALGKQHQLCGRSTPNHAGADHTVRTEITILEGHH